MDQLPIKIGFDRALSPRLRELFIEPLAQVLEFGDLREERFHKRGWGIGDALVVQVSLGTDPDVDADPDAENSDLYVNLRFRGEITSEQAEQFTDLLRKELTRDGNKKDAWGMGVARVIAVANMAEED